MSNEALEAIMTPGFILFFVIVVAIGSLIPAVMTKFVMRAVFGHETSFGLILLAMVVTSFLSLVTMLWIGITPDRWERMPMVPTALLSTAAILVQLVLLTVMVPERDGDLVPMWKWAVTLVLQYLMFVLLALLLGLLFAFLMAASQATS